ncbi:MAG TPA: hypothetical protein DEP46_15545 [Blastocatellia bacterium]|nr:hypothetical protein [Blastocatellia bacterium]
MKHPDIQLKDKARFPDSDIRSGHSSLNQFSIAEAIADMIFEGIGENKACQFEPNDRPCDHCSMCSSRGF